MNTKRLKTTSALMLTLGFATGMGLSRTAAAAAQGQEAASKETTPAEVVGRWITANVSATTYWNSNTHQFLGNGSQNAQIYEFDGKGGFTY